MSRIKVDKIALKEKFDRFIESFVLDEKGDIYHSGEWYIAKDLMFSDLNVEINHEDKIVGIRSDDDFHSEACFPYEYRFLNHEYIIKKTFPDKDIEITPTSVWKKSTKARREFYARRIKGEWLDYNLKHRTLGELIESPFDRYAILRAITKDHPRYKEVYNFKMKKRYRIVRKKNKKYRYAMFIHLPSGGSTMATLTREQNERQRRESAILDAEHKKASTLQIEKDYPDDMEMQEILKKLGTFRKTFTSVEIEYDKKRNEQ